MADSADSIATAPPSSGRVLSFKYRLYPNKAQAATLTEMLGAFCDLYNAALQQRIEAYRRRGVTLRLPQQSLELKATRSADERLARFSFSAEEQLFRRLDKAFSAFFARLKRGDRPGFPRFRAKDRFDSADFRVGDGLTIRKTGRLRVVGVPGEIKVKWHRGWAPGGSVRAANISRSCGKWFVCLQAEVAHVEQPARPRIEVGVDLGLTSLVALSTGEGVATPAWFGKSAKSLRVAQRVVARRKLGSSRRRKAKIRVARLSARVANQRRDFSHKLSRSLVDRFSHLAFEGLNIKGLAAGMLAKSVHNAAWSQLVQHVTYKAESAGSVVALVDPRYTSQTCPECGQIAAKTLKIREHRCDCGCVLDRDVAAARVILQRANFGREPAVGRQASGVPHSLPEKPTAQAVGVLTSQETPDAG